MTAPEVSELERAVKSIVRKAKKEGKTHELTPRIIRQTLEKDFDLEAGSLDVYKDVLKAATKSAMDEAHTEPESHGNGDTTKKRKSNTEGNEQQTSKKAKTASKAGSNPKEQSATAKKSKDKAYKSAEIIPTSDIESDVEENAATTSTSFDPQVGKPPSPRPPKTSSVKKRSSDKNLLPKKRQNDAPLSDTKGEIEDIDSAPQLEVADHPNSSTIAANENTQKSESENSVLIDEPPERTKKSKSKDKDPQDKKPTKEKRQKKPAAELSKDEETIKRLKSFVTACGVRKVWAKEFQGLDRPSEQIKHLKTILADLGMSGRLSLERAKAIKEKRELAKELEDVQSFEKSVAAQSSRSKAKAQSEDPGTDESSGAEVTEAPTKRKRNARQSIMAFLGDQSDED